MFLFVHSISSYYAFVLLKLILFCFIWFLSSRNFNITYFIFDPGMNASLCVQQRPLFQPFYQFVFWVCIWLRKTLLFLPTFLRILLSIYFKLLWKMVLRFCVITPSAVGQKMLFQSDTNFIVFSCIFFPQGYFPPHWKYLHYKVLMLFETFFIVFLIIPLFVVFFSTWNITSAYFLSPRELYMMTIHWPGGAPDRRGSNNPAPPFVQWSYQTALFQFDFTSTIKHYRTAKYHPIFSVCISNNLRCGDVSCVTIVFQTRQPPNTKQTN